MLLLLFAGAGVTTPDIPATGTTHLTLPTRPLDLTVQPRRTLTLRTRSPRLSLRRRR